MLVKLHKPKHYGIGRTDKYKSEASMRGSKIE